jgi:hypothetical protein
MIRLMIMSCTLTLIYALYKVVNEMPVKHRHILSTEVKSIHSDRVRQKFLDWDKALVGGVFTRI